MYTLRYREGTDLNDRKHKYTQVKGKLVDVLDFLEGVPEYFQEKLEVVKR